MCMAARKELAEMEKYEVYSIKRKDGAMTIDYSVMPQDGPPESCCVTRSERPHPDFVEAFKPLQQMARRFIEIPLVNPLNNKGLMVAVKQVRFKRHKDFGTGITITVEVSVLNLSDKGIKITSPTFYEAAPDCKFDAKGDYVPQQELFPEEYTCIERLKEEAFLYAYQNKREQVTVEEAAAEAGYYP